MKIRLKMKKNVLFGGIFLVAAAIALIILKIKNGKAANAAKETKGTNIINDIIFTGNQKIKNLVSKFNHDDFDSSKTFKINMHIHSTASDGVLTSLQVLQQAKEAADAFPKGEIVAMIYGNETDKTDMDEVLNKGKKLLQQGFSKKDTVKILTTLFDVGKNEVYEKIHSLM